MSGNAFAVCGKVSWFNDGVTASGISAATNPGISLLNHDGLSEWWYYKPQQGRAVVTRQIDIGPAAWTGRIFDMSEPLRSYVGSVATDSTACGWILENVGRGSSRKDAGQIRRLLRRHGHRYLRARGRFDRRLKLSVELFQRYHRLRANGVVGPETWAALYKARLTR